MLQDHTIMALLIECICLCIFLLQGYFYSELSTAGSQSDSQDVCAWIDTSTRDVYYIVPQIPMHIKFYINCRNIKSASTKNRGAE